MMRTMRSILGIACFILIARSVNLKAAEKPNVIIVITDDQGYGDLACHGNPYIKTPAIDAFSNEAETQTVDVSAIPDGWQGLDAGPRSFSATLKKEHDKFKFKLTHYSTRSFRCDNHRRFFAGILAGMRWSTRLEIPGRMY